MMYAIVWGILQSPTLVSGLSGLIQLGAVIFGLGAGWQQLRELNRRVGRIEKKIFNGDTN